MKKIFLAAAFALMALAGSAKTNYTILRACHPDDVKKYDTEQLRSHFMRSEEHTSELQSR